MKIRQSLLGGFIPWVLFSIFYHPHTHYAALVSLAALLLTIYFNWQELKKRFVLPWGSLIFFAWVFLNEQFALSQWATNHPQLINHSALAVIVIFSMIIGKPFTLQYAREQVPKEKWQKPLFIKVNWIITAIWAALMIITALPSYILSQDQIYASWFYTWGLSVLCILIGLQCNRSIPKWLSKGNRG